MNFKIKEIVSTIKENFIVITIAIGKKNIIDFIRVYFRLKLYF